MTVPLLPNGWGRGFAIGARGALGVFETQLRREGYEEVRIEDGWLPFLPWIPTVGRRYFVPPWLMTAADVLWPVMRGLRSEGRLVRSYRDRIIAFWSAGVARERAAAMVSAALLAGESETARVLAVEELLKVYESGGG